LRFDANAWRTRLQQLGTITDVSGVSLAAFRAKGGKLILTHGTADDLISPHNSEDYYRMQVGAFGQPAVDAFIRFYVTRGTGTVQGLTTWDTTGSACSTRGWTRESRRR